MRLVPGDDGRVEVRRASDNRLAAVVGKADGANRVFRTITADGRFVATARSEKRGIEIWDTARGQRVSVREYERGASVVGKPNYMDQKAPPVSNAIYNQIREG